MFNEWIMLYCREISGTLPLLHVGWMSAGCPLIIWRLSWIWKIRYSIHSYGFTTRHLLNVTNRSNRPNIRHVLHPAWKNFITRDITFHFRNDFLTESLHALITAYTHTHTHGCCQGTWNTTLPSQTPVRLTWHQPQWGFPLPKRSLHRRRVAFVETYQRSLPSVQSHIVEQKHENTHVR